MCVSRLKGLSNWMKMRVVAVLPIATLRGSQSLAQSGAPISDTDLSKETENPCSYCIRQTRMRKVVYAIRSPIMGGHSKWKMLQDKEISGVIPEVFGRFSEIAGAVMREVAELAPADLENQQVPWVLR